MKTVFSIEGMSCAHCVRAVDEAIKSVSGVEGVDVSLEEKKAVVVGNFDVNAAKAAVEDEGYTITDVTES
ncbi:heavy metal-associated domain-containing protein [Peptoniphilus equinus]|uniref:Heavy metal-associated domain-containing protein n=1 Tax=Peptoniphilus equinus TaxID=3016343 RepID=A0ABY7QUY8_9FIRM|nr:heavy metal-associated domain-containing protein [Peptoniphilus equinus]WBW50176.1 heavy metal-associated domain-containing protein [Peptoniphilus equinus]